MSFIETALRVQDILAFYVVQPLIIVMLGIFIGKVVEQVVVYIGRVFAPKRSRVKVLAVVLAWATYIFAFLAALESIGVLRVALSVFSTIVLVVVGLHLLLSLRDFLGNYAHFRSVRKRVGRGSVIATPYGTGTVIAVLLGDTHLELKNGEDLYIPNKTMRSTKIEVVKKA